MTDRVSIKIENHIADVRLTRADKMNALDPAMFAAIIDAQQQLEKNKEVRAVVLSGEGASFCAGLDLASMQGLNASDHADSELSPARLEKRTHGNTNTYQEVVLGWRKLPMPVIAAVHGVCFGGGLQIASGADIRVMAPDSRLSIMEMRWGLMPDMGSFALWRTFVRDDVLRTLTYTAAEFSGSQALQYGFATEVNDQPLTHALALAAEIASKNPTAIRAAKGLINQLADLSEDDILMTESVEQQKIMSHPNQMEAVTAAMQKRPAKFTD